MKSIEIIGFKRANLGKSASSEVRAEGHIPAVLYGGETQIHFFVPAYLLRDLVYTKEAKIVDLTVDGVNYKAIMQDLQFHPVNEAILHVDFLQIFEDKLVKIDIPVRIIGNSPGVQVGGKLVVKQNTLKIKALPANLPDFIDVNIEGLELGKSTRVGDVKKGEYEILNPNSLPIASVTIPRALRNKQNEEAAAAAGGKKKK